MMIDFSQRDSLWAGDFIGRSKLTVGRFGCTLTGIADLSTYFGDDFNPGSLAKMDIFTPEGLVIWQKCNFKTFQFSQRLYDRNDFLVKAALIDPDQAVLLQVAHGSHWVVATGWRSKGQFITISDPWFGDRADMQRYDNSITGLAFFRKKK